MASSYSPSATGMTSPTATPLASMSPFRPGGKYSGKSFSCWKMICSPFLRLTFREESRGVAGIDVLSRRLDDLGQEDTVLGRGGESVREFTGDDGQDNGGQGGSELPDLFVDSLIVGRVQFLRPDEKA